jgi:two-component system, NarL family, sensor histidine kinase DesK
VNTYVEPGGPDEADWVASQRQWTLGWRRLAWTAVPLVYLIYVAGAVDTQVHGAAAAWGYAILVMFAACWLAAPLLLGPGASARRYWTLYGLLFALFVAELPFARATSFALCLFLSMLIVARLGGRSAPIVAALALAALVIPVAITSWHVSLSDSIGNFTPVAIPVAGLVTFAVLKVMRGNEALAEARAELARLAAENERYRIARDLHDLLGHSLTTITVKAGLACRLGATDPGLGLREMAEVESLARQTLTDVRAAVAGYRDVTLMGELATGLELLRAAGITADLPHAIDVVDPAHQELFGWVVREGLTNIVRHSRASSCAVRLSSTSVEIVDDGVGGYVSAGNGLTGLQERVAAAGGTIDAGPAQPAGWRLQVRLSPAGGV